MTHIEKFFEILEKEGLYDGRIAVAGKEYVFPAKTGSQLISRGKPYLKFEKLLKYGSVFFILLLTVFVLLNLPVKKSSSAGRSPGNARETEKAGLPGHGGENRSMPGETAEKKARELNLAGIKFYPVGSDEYAFSYLSEKIFLYKIRTSSTDIRLIVNDLVDRVNEQAKKTKVEASVLTPRHKTNQYHIKLWQGGFLERGQVFMLRLGEAVLVKETNSDLVAIDPINDWEALCRDKTVFIRIMLRKRED